jgi:hypothetical protein
MKSQLVLFYFFFLIQRALAQNVMISNQNFPNEPSIMMDPKHPNRLIAASNIDNYYISNDYGATWTENQLNSTQGVWGDPVIVVDTASNFYYFHLSNPLVGGSWIDRIVCQKTTDVGQNWNNGTYTGLNGSKVQDKHWATVDRVTNILYVTWTQFDAYDSSNPNDSTIILFSKSLDGGANWSNPKRISSIAGTCIDGDYAVEGAYPTVGPNGEVYVVWASINGLMFNKSYDQGETWMTNEMVISTIPSGWDYSISGISRANGLPFVQCDLSGGSNNGTIYVNWSDQRNGVLDTDIWLIKSTDGGNSWTSPTKVNDDPPGKQQFFTSMALDQTNGNLYCVFYDRRNYSSDSTDVYIAYSTDGGVSFINKRISELPFLPNSSIFFGDYTGIVAHDGIIRPIWTRLNAGQLSVWTHLTTHESLEIDESEKNTSLEFESYPNPSTNFTYVSFKIYKSSNLKLVLIDENGKVIEELIPEKITNPGKYVEFIDFTKFDLKSGTYLIKLTINGMEKIARQVKI